MFSSTVVCACAPNCMNINELALTRSQDQWFKPSGTSCLCIQYQICVICKYKPHSRAPPPKRDRKSAKRAWCILAHDGHQVDMTERWHKQVANVEQCFFYHLGGGAWERGYHQVWSNSALYLHLQWQQSSGGLCNWQIRACGYQREGDPQDNWVFTQHISKDVDPALDNYPIQINVNITNRLSSCIRRFGCNPQFKAYLNLTNTPTDADITGSGFMNTENYELLETIRPNGTTMTFHTVVTFMMQPGETGFYLALRDQGTCVEISRILVQRFNCAPFQDGLIIYPDSPAPVTGSAPVAVSCVSNGAVSSQSPHAQCGSNGQWVSQTPTCGCSPGYEINLITRDKCDSEFNCVYTSIICIHVHDMYRLYTLGHDSLCVCHIYNVHVYIHSTCTCKCVCVYVRNYRFLYRLAYTYNVWWM